MSGECNNVINRNYYNKHEKYSVSQFSSLLLNNCLIFCLTLHFIIIIIMISDILLVSSRTHLVETVIREGSVDLLLVHLASSTRLLPAVSWLQDPPQQRAHVGVALLSVPENNNVVQSL